MADEETFRQPFDELSCDLLSIIFNKLDVVWICSVAATCSSLKNHVSKILSCLSHLQMLDVPPSMEIMQSWLPPMLSLKSTKVDCGNLDDSAIEFLVRPSLQELCLYNCAGFSGKLLHEIGDKCKDLRSLYLTSVAEKEGLSIQTSDLEELLKNCSQLEALALMFDNSRFPILGFVQVWELASSKLTSLEIGCISYDMVAELLHSNIGLRPSSNDIREPILPCIQKLCLELNTINDAVVFTISKGLYSLIHLDLRDAPSLQPSTDLTNNGLKKLNPQGTLKHLSLIRSQEFANTYFKKVNDIGISFLADKCAEIKSICLGGFCCITNKGYKALLSSCLNLDKLGVFQGILLTDPFRNDIFATSLLLRHVSLRGCQHITNKAIMILASVTTLKALDLRECRGLGDEALQAITFQPQLKILLLDESNITDLGMSVLREEVISSLVSLSVRGCKRLADRWIIALFDSSSKLRLQKLDLSNLPNLSDNGILALAKSGVPISELRMRRCPQISDTSIKALATMQVDDNSWNGSTLRLLDVYKCGGITQLAFEWLQKPYFPRLRWLGVKGIGNRDFKDAFARQRPNLKVEFCGKELEVDHWNNSNGLYMH